MKTLVVILFIVLFLLIKIKWVLFLLMSLPIRVYLGLRMKKKDVLIPLSKTYYPVKKSTKANVINLIESYIHYAIRITGEIPSHLIRNYIYRQIFRVKLGDKTVIYHGVEIRDPFHLRIGDGTIIGDNAILDARYGIIFGKNVNTSSNISIWTEQHDHRDPWFRCNPERLGSVIIGDRAWIGSNVTILPNIKIGEGAVIAAGSVVCKDVLPFNIVGGVPAKVIGIRNNNLLYEFQGEHRHFI